MKTHVKSFEADRLSAESLCSQICVYLMDNDISPDEIIRFDLSVRVESGDLLAILQHKELSPKPTGRCGASVIALWNPQNFAEKLEEGLHRLPPMLAQGMVNSTLEKADIIVWIGIHEIRKR